MATTVGTGAYPMGSPLCSCKPHAQQNNARGLTPLQPRCQANGLSGVPLSKAHDRAQRPVSLKQQWPPVAQAIHYKFPALSRRRTCCWRRQRWRTLSLMIAH